MASILELENYVLKEKDRIREVLSDRYGVRERDIVVDVHNTVGVNYDEFDEAFERGKLLTDIYKFKFRVTLCEGNSAPIELALFGMKLFKKTKGSYVSLLYVPGYEPKDALPGCAHYYYDVYDFVTYEKVMRRSFDHLREVVNGLYSGSGTGASPLTSDEDTETKIVETMNDDFLD